MKNFEKISTKEYFDKESIKNYTGNEFDDIDLNAEHIENAFTNEKYYSSMKLLPLQEKKVLYYSVIENYPLRKNSQNTKYFKKRSNKFKRKSNSRF